MSKKSKVFSSLLLVVVFLFTSCVSAYAAKKNVVTANISMGVGDMKDLSVFIRSNETIKWSSSASSIVKVGEGNTIIGKNKGYATINGSSKNYTYAINVRILANCSTSDNVSSATATQIKKKTDDLNYTEFSFSMGPKDTINVAPLVEDGYTSYRWRTVRSYVNKVSRGKIIGKGEGINKVTATSTKNSGSSKNKVYRFNVTVDNNAVAKNLSIRKNTKMSLQSKLENPVADYVYSSEGAAASVSDDGYITTKTNIGDGGIVTATSTTGGKNYTFIIKVI